MILTKERAAAFSELLSYMAKHKKAYHLESSDTISQYANSLHHEGVCLLTKDAPPLKLKDVFNHLKNNKPILLLALENIDNPHNFRGHQFVLHPTLQLMLFFISIKIPIIRTLHGPSVVFKEALSILPLVKVFEWSELIDFCSQKKISIFTTSDSASKAVSLDTFLEKSLIVYGNEGEGISNFWKKITTTHIKIHGTNKVESLNISVANGILLSFYQQNHLPLTSTH